MRKNRTNIQAKCRLCGSPVARFGEVCCDPEFDPEQAFRDGELFAVEAVVEFAGEVQQ